MACQTPLSAQSRVSAQSRTSPSLTWPFVAYAGAAAVDLHSTYLFLQHDGYREANPLGRWLDHSPPLLVAFSAAADASACYTVYKIWGRHHRTAARIVLYSIAAVRVGLAVRNYRGDMK